MVVRKGFLEVRGDGRDGVTDCHWPSRYDRSGCNHRRMRWCLACEEWVRPVPLRIITGPIGGRDRETGPTATRGACPNGEGAGHALRDMIGEQVEVPRIANDNCWYPAVYVGPGEPLTPLSVPEIPRGIVGFEDGGTMLLEYRFIRPLS